MEAIAINVLGVLLGAVITGVVSHVYYRRSSSEFRAEVSKLASQNDRLARTIDWIATSLQDKGLVELLRNPSGEVAGATRHRTASNVTAALSYPTAAAETKEAG